MGLLTWYREHADSRSVKTGIAFGIIASFALLVGAEVYRSNSVAAFFEGPGSLALGIVAFAASAIVIGIIAGIVFVLARKLSQKDLVPISQRLSTWPAWFATTAVLVLFWLPCLLAYWPGLFSYDITTQTDYVTTGHWTTQQPPLHTLFWAAMLWAEGVFGCKATTLYAVVQMVFLAGAFSFVLRFLAQRRISRWIWLGSFLFFALNPVVALFSIEPVKDSLLAGFLALVIVQVCKIVAEGDSYFRSPASVVCFVVCSVACCLLRTNMIAAFAIFALVALAVLPDIRRRIALCCATVIAIVLVVVVPGYSALGISSGSSAVASVPFQQVANVVRSHADQLSEKELQTVDGILPADKLADAYNPRFADKVVRLFKGKSTGVAGVREQLTDFAWLWVSWMPRYLPDYVDAFLALNVPYWYPFAQTPDPYSQRDYIETEVWKSTENYTYEPASLLPELKDAYERVADFSAFRDTPLATLFSPATVLWMMLIAFFLLYNATSRRYSLVVVLPILFWATFMIGPVSIMRYEFPLFALYPLLVSAALQPNMLFAGQKG